jgi:hypothetical protein
MFANQVVVGDYFQMEAQYNGTFTAYTHLWGVQNQTGVQQSLNSLSALEYRAIIIG